MDPTSLEGGLFAQNNEGSPSYRVKNFNPETGECEFSFISFGGRHRLNVFLEYNHDDQNTDSICFPIYSEVKQPEAEKKPV